MFRVSTPGPNPPIPQWTSAIQVNAAKESHDLQKGEKKSRSQARLSHAAHAAHAHSHAVSRWSRGSCLCIMYPCSQADMECDYQRGIEETFDDLAKEQADKARKELEEAATATAAAEQKITPERVDPLKDPLVLGGLGSSGFSSVPVASPKLARS